jgi:hypothetical protein
MWRTHTGDRVLTDAEWCLFEVGLDGLRDSIEVDISTQGDDTETGVSVFDRLTPEQQLVILADTASALRDPNIPTPRHTAANEATIAAVLAEVRGALEMELDYARMEGVSLTAETTEVRRMILALWEDDSEEWGEPLPNNTDADAEGWVLLLELFEERILWDCDFEMGDEFLDLPPDVARERLQLCRIDPDYYLTSPDEPDAATLTGARRTLARLLGLPTTDEGSPTEK